MKIAIVALGPSWHQYNAQAEAAGGHKAAFDEVWAINQAGLVIHCDKIFHMDDLRVQETRGEAGNVKIKNMIKALKSAGVPIVTSTAYPEWPMAVEYPLEEVIHALGAAYFNSTPPYALAYAIWMAGQIGTGIESLEVSLFGMDYTWPNAHEAEKGRGCMEFWVAMAMCCGVQIQIARGSTLLDQNEKHSFYGYDGRKVLLTADENGKTMLKFGEIDVELPSAEEMERRYSHGG